MQGKWRQSGFLTQVSGQLREAVFLWPWRGLITSVLIALRLGPINCSHNMNYVMLYNVLAVFQLCSPLVFKQVGSPAGGDDDERHTKGQVLRWVPRWGARAHGEHDVRHADRHAACSVPGSPTRE